MSGQPITFGDSRTFLRQCAQALGINKSYSLFSFSFCMSSVRVRLISVCQIYRISWKLIGAWTISSIPPLFVAQGPSFYSQENKLSIDFTFGRYIHRSIHPPNKSPLKISEKVERGRIQGLPKCFAYPLLSQERIKLRTSNFVRTFTGSIGTEAH